jgi:hypothetical protein
MIIKFFLTLMSIIRAIINYRIGAIKIANPKYFTEICILGNGPSLAENMMNDRKFISARDSMCVNNFVESDRFEEIKPRYYLLLDPDYWRKESLQELIELRERIYAQINLKTTWSLTLLLPRDARYALDWNKIFGSNQHINIAYFNSTPLSGYEFVIHWLFKYNFGMPPAQNVLVAAIFVAINIGYNNVYLFGADHSWHEDIVVNKDNIVCYKNKHFYDKYEAELIPWQKGDNSGATWKMHEILMALAKMFQGYQSLEQYSKSKNIHIYNASTITNIDAFDRYNTQEVHE